MALTDKQVQHVCLAHAGARTCRYLENDPKNWRLHHCLKQLKGKKRVIDKKTAEHIAELRKQGGDPMQGWRPIGDGGFCQGYPYLPTIQQGYDTTHNKISRKKP